MFRYISFFGGSFLIVAVVPIDTVFLHHFDESSASLCDFPASIYDDISLFFFSTFTHSTRGACTVCPFLLT